MPLRRGSDIDFTVEEGVSVQFVMIDEAGSRAACRVSWEALQDKESSLNGVDAFLKHRAEIENVASRLFDSRAMEPFVTLHALKE